MKVLDIANLSIRSSDGSMLVSNLNLSMEPGQRLGIIGESGSGKSITALSIMGLLPGDLTATGSICVSDGAREPVEMIGARESARNQVRGEIVSIIFQEPLTALDPLMRIGRQLFEPIRRHRRCNKDEMNRMVLEALDEVSINDPRRVMHSYPHEISGGERQRVAIAMALACEPTLLIADEATTALDVTVQAEVISLIDGLVDRRGMSLLFISHDLGVVSQISDSAHVLQEGRLVESGSIREIIRSPKDSYTRELVNSAVRLDLALNSAIGGDGHANYHS